MQSTDQVLRTESERIIALTNSPTGMLGTQNRHSIFPEYAQQRRNEANGYNPPSVKITVLSNSLCTVFNKDRQYSDEANW